MGRERNGFAGEFSNIDFVDESAMSIIEQIVSDIDIDLTVRLYFVACNENRRLMHNVWEKSGSFKIPITRYVLCAARYCSYEHLI